MTRNATTDKDQAQSDHDILIEMRTEFREFRGQMATDMKGVKDSLDSQHANMNARIIILESFNAKNNLEEQVKIWNTTAEWVKTYRGRWKWVAGAIGLASGVFVYLVDHVLPLIRFK